MYCNILGGGLGSMIALLGTISACKNREQNNQATYHINRLFQTLGLDPYIDNPQELQSKTPEPPIDTNYVILSQPGEPTVPEDNAHPGYTQHHLEPMKPGEVSDAVYPDLHPSGSETVNRYDNSHLPQEVAAFFKAFNTVKQPEEHSNCTGDDKLFTNGECYTMLGKQECAEGEKLILNSLSKIAICVLDPNQEKEQSS